MLQQIQAQTIIVIHPGSMYLRMGRASDLKPVTLLHAVARRRLANGIKYKDNLLPSTVTLVSIKYATGFSYHISICNFVFGRQRN